MTIPGITAKHAIITPACRANRGDDGAFEEAVKRLREEYKTILNLPGNEAVTFHAVLLVQRTQLLKTNKSNDEHVTA